MGVVDAKVEYHIKPKELTDVVDDLIKVTPYKTTHKGDPPVRKQFPLEPTDTADIRAEQLIHSLVRIDTDNDNIQAENQ